MNDGWKATSCAVAIGWGLAASGALSGTASAQETIRVGYLPQVHDAAVFAVERELGERYNLEFIQFLRYTDVEVALSRGDLDMSSTGYSTAISSAVRGGEPAFVFVSGLSRGAVNLVCRNEVEIDDWADLRGRSFGVLTGGTAQIFFDDALSLHGVGPDEIERVSFAAPGPPLLQAMADNTIECMGAFEPFTATAVHDGYGYYPPTILADNRFLGINGAFAVNTDFLAERPDVVQDVVEVLLEATEHYNADHAQWVADVAPRINVAADIVAIAVERVILDSNMYQERTHTLAQVMEDLGFIPQAPDAERVNAYFNFDFITEAAGKPADEVGRSQ